MDVGTKERRVSENTCFPSLIKQVPAVNAVYQYTGSSATILKE